MFSCYVTHIHVGQLAQVTDQKKKVQKQLRDDINLSVKVTTTHPQV